VHQHQFMVIEMHMIKWQMLIFNHILHTDIHKDKLLLFFRNKKINSANGKITRQTDVFKLQRIDKSAFK
jgi:hypothetical protein